MSITIGQIAPDFKLYNSDKKEIGLSDFKGKNLLILFFPQAFTGTCTTELCTMRDDITTYTSLNTEIVGISVDSLFTLGAYKQDQHLNFDLLSDFNKLICKEYDSYLEDFAFGMKGVSKRSAFIVDKNGLIQYAEICEKLTDLPNFEAIKTCLENLK